MWRIREKEETCSNEMCILLTGALRLNGAHQLSRDKCKFTRYIRWNFHGFFSAGPCVNSSTGVFARQVDVSNSIGISLSLSLSLSLSFFLPLSVCLFIWIWMAFTDSNFRSLGRWSVCSSQLERFKFQTGTICLDCAPVSSATGSLPPSPLSIYSTAIRVDLRILTMLMNKSV